ncbi:penicillin acylase family protein, partial [Streptosporangium sandarakinum]
SDLYGLAATVWTTDLSRRRRPARRGGPLSGRQHRLQLHEAVELTPAGPRTRAVLTYSLSAGVASPHHTDQSELFSRGGWVTERFTETEIRAYPYLTTTPLRPSSPPA